MKKDKQQNALFDSVVVDKRAPIVTIMGHVDHGKTTLLDYILKTNIVEKEYGGITQQVRAYQVFYENYPITFIDTPGHEIFYSMRERGANITDIIALVVAADDSVMPQTKEVISLWKKIKSHLIVVINKIDLSTANIERVKSDLAKEGVYLEGYGGDIPYVELSAKKGINVDKFLELINLIAEINELHKFKDISKANFEAELIVLESYLDKALGPVISTIVKSGKIRRGEYMAATGIYSRVRAIINDRNLTIEEAIESMPVRVVGLPVVLEVGETVRVYDDEYLAREFSKQNLVLRRTEGRKKITKEYLRSMLIGQQTEKKKELSVMLIADTRGSQEAILKALNKLNSDDNKVRLSIVQAKVGLVNTNDIDLAKIQHSIILTFNVEIDAKTRRYAELNKVLIREYKIVYELVDEVYDVLSSIGDEEVEEEVVGEGLVLQVFKLSNGKFVAGTRVIKGRFVKNFDVRVVRLDNVVNEGRIQNLKHLKEEVKEVSAGMDCGVLIEPNLELLNNDKIICFKKIKRSLL